MRCRRLNASSAKTHNASGLTIILLFKFLNFDFLEFDFLIIFFKNLILIIVFFIIDLIL